jgi:hypothetical protein
MYGETENPIIAIIAANMVAIATMYPMIVSAVITYIIMRHNSVIDTPRTKLQVLVGSVKLGLKVGISRSRKPHSILGEIVHTIIDSTNNKLFFDIMAFCLFENQKDSVL